MRANGGECSISSVSFADQDCRLVSESKYHALIWLQLLCIRCSRISKHKSTSRWIYGLGLQRKLNAFTEARVTNNYWIYVTTKSYSMRLDLIPFQINQEKKYIVQFFLGHFSHNRMIGAVTCKERWFIIIKLLLTKIWNGVFTVSKNAMTWRAVVFIHAHAKCPVLYKPGRICMWKRCGHRWQ